jgi:hypothetical protein
MGGTGRWAAFAAVVVGLMGASAASAEEAPTRSEYVMRLEPICKPGAEATQRTMKGVRDDVEADRLGVAAGKFTRAAAIFAGTVDSIAAEPRPAADLERLRKWFTFLGRQEDYLRQIAEELRAERTIKAQRLTARFIHNGNLANNVVLAFGFNHCSFKFSRFR